MHFVHRSENCLLKNSTTYSYARHFWKLIYHFSLSVLKNHMYLALELVRVFSFFFLRNNTIILVYHTDGVQSKVLQLKKSKLSPLIRRASVMSLGMMVTRRAWMAQRTQSSKTWTWTTAAAAMTISSTNEITVSYSILIHLIWDNKMN